MNSCFRKKCVEVFVRHCHLSMVSQHKQRFPGFSRELCFHNFINTVDHDLVNVTFLLDTHYPMEEEHFVKRQKLYPVIEINEGTESGSFLQLLNYVTQLKLSEETIIYFLEDDYIHRPHWGEVLIEGFTLSDADYITLYDHRDKYCDSSYRHLLSTLYHTRSCHWRTTPSTTNTYAMRFKTLEQHLPIHRAFSLDCKVTRDHEKFCKLQNEGALLLSPIPGWSTHAEPALASPCIPWENYFTSEIRTGTPGTLGT
jgi:hypothetical protein